MYNLNKQPTEYCTILSFNSITLPVISSDTSSLPSSVVSATSHSLSLYRIYSTKRNVSIKLLKNNPLPSIPHQFFFKLHLLTINNVTAPNTIKIRITKIFVNIFPPKIKLVHIFKKGSLFLNAPEFRK